MNNNDRINLIHRISEIEGLSDKERSALLGLLRESKTYGLVWEDKPETVEERLRNELPVLTEVKERALLSEDKDAPNHILIEGDNLEALTTLAYTHAGRIDVIYIDPPYNTGNKDFVYNDSFVDKEDSYRHSKWLSFMSRRLKIAKNILANDGVIFIQVDDNEAANLKLLCDSIFGEINALGPFIQNKLNAKNDTLNIQKNHEYIFCYRLKAKIDIETHKEIPVLINKTWIEKEVYAENGEYYYFNDSITTRGEGGTLKKRPNLGYSFYVNPKTLDFVAIMDYDPMNIKSFTDESIVYIDNKSVLQNGYTIIIRPPRVRNELGVWTWELNKVNAEKSNLKIVKTKSGYSVKKRTFVPANEVERRNGKFWYKKLIESNSKSFLEYSTNEGSNTYNDIFNHAVEFNNPKNVALISYLLRLFYRQNITVLDFFAGSGTTLHATMQLNAEDGGHRQCILVTNNENGICENVTYERNKRVIQGYTTPKGEHVTGLTNNNLRYYRTGFVSRNGSVQNMRRLVNLSTDMLCIKEDLYAEQPTFCGERTYKGIFRYFDDGQKQMLVIYREEVIDRLVELIYGMGVESKIKIYVFSPSEDPWEDSFEDVSDKVELCALPAAIYNAYRRILPKKKDAVVLPEKDAPVTNEKENPTDGMLNFTDEGDEA